jgi:hypothetical protein
MSRDPGFGTFRKLVETIPAAGQEGSPGRRVWMSDTRAEIMEHTPALNRLFFLRNVKNKRILINGLGLGVVVHAALTYGGIDHVDVVENNPDVLALVGPLIPDPRVTFHLGDAYDIKWPPGTRWDIAWHDIWPSIDNDNLPGMDKLLRKYKNRVGWQGCWRRKSCLAMARDYKRMEEGTLPVERALEIVLGRVPWLE